MNTKRKLLHASSIVGYVVAFLYLVLTALLYSVGNNLFWLVLVLGGLSLFNSLYTATFREKMTAEAFTKNDKIKLVVVTVISTVSLPSLILNLMALLIGETDKTLIIDNPHYTEVKREPKVKKWYRKSSFILTCIGLFTVIVASFIAQIGETSGYSVNTRDFTLTKEMTDTYNTGTENALNGKNFTIQDPVLTYAVTEYRPKSATSANPAPVIFVMPGFTRTKATMAQYAIEFSKRGIVTYVVDPGCQGGTTYSGYEEDSEGGKEMISSTVGANGLDYLVQYIYNNTEEYTYIDRDKFGAVGHSAGGGNVGQLAQDFAGNSYEESIIKSVYISGYIKVSLANRFKSLRCNAALSYAYYDEGSFRYQGTTSAFEVIARRFVNEVNGTDLGYEEAAIDYGYGQMEEGNYRVIHREYTNHCFEMYDGTSIANTIGFFRESLGVKTDIADTSHTWLVKEGFNGVALCAIFVLIFALMAFLVDTLPLFKSFKIAAEKAQSYEDTKKIQYGFKSSNIADLKEGSSPIKISPKKFGDKVLFWSIVVISAIIACLDYIPLARLSMDWFPDAAGNTFTFFFPARMMNAVMLWAVVNGLIGFILIFGTKLAENLYYKFKKQPENCTWYRYQGMKIGWKNLLKSIGLALFLFLLFYGIDQLISVIFHQDFRFTLISAATLQPRFIVTLLIYLLPFFIFYLSNSVRVNLSMATEGWSEWKVMLLGGIGNSIGLIFIIVINYAVYFQTGTVFYGYYSAADTSEMWLYINMVFGLIPMMFLLPILNRFCFKKTGNVYFGAMVTCLIFIMMSLSASVSYIPL